MDAFELPSFYLPYPARINPNLEAAREHNAAWIRRVGLLDAPAPGASGGTGPVWNEAAVAAMDVPLLAAYAHPDCDAATLALMADWYSWAFFHRDDARARFRTAGDRPEARAHVALLEGVVDGRAADPPEQPGEADEADTDGGGLADLWERTAPALPEGLCDRFTADLRGVIADALREADQRGRTPNPVEHLQDRRAGGGGLFCADLAEYAAGAALGAAAQGRAVRVLREAFADAVHLRNDLFSYRLDAADGRRDNAVQVYGGFLGCPTQEAAELVNDLLTSRMVQFEDTAVGELAEGVAAAGGLPGEAAAAAALAKALQDWQAGGHEWHAATARYTGDPSPRPPASAGGPTGLGTSSARVPALNLDFSPGLRRRARRHGHEIYPETGHLPLPDIPIHYPLRMSPHLDAAREHSLEWVRSMGMLDEVPGVGAVVWSEEKFTGYDLALCAAAIHADSSLEKLEVSTDWLCWGTYGDDYYPLVYGARRDVAAGRLSHERLGAFMPLDLGLVPEPLDPMERGLEELWRRSAAPLPMAAREAFRTSVREMTASWVWELDNQAANRVPDPVDYLEMRRRTFGSDMTMGLARMEGAGDVPPEVFVTRTVRELETSAQDVACILNDLFSYQKEIEREGELHNMVLVVENFLGTDRITARDAVADLLRVRLDQFDRLDREGLPALFEDMGLDNRAQDALRRYADLMKDWMSGILHWHREVVRYRKQDLASEPAPRRAAMDLAARAATRIPSGPPVPGAMR
uniref:terpene synthase family protein n=1 Tax=Nocardiopsis halophila TaxID=141692 RepID=UPI000380EE6F|nr:hypothetical protein [Nocardiopsis halophila]